MGTALVPLLLALWALLPLRAVGAAALPPGAEPCFTNAVPADHGTFRLLKSADFVQSSAATPTGGQGLADIRLTPPPGLGLTNASVSGPAGFQADLTRQADGSSTWTAQDTEAALMARMPAGAWSTFLQMAPPSGDSFVGILPFNLASNLPPVPTVLNYDAAQNVEATAPFELSWSAWAGVTTADRVSLQILDTAGRTVISAASDCSGAISLPVTATTLTVPAGTLAAGTSYTGYLTFGANLLAATDAGFVERAFQSRTTRFSLRTRGGGGTATPGEFLPPVVSGTNLVFTLKGDVGSRHVIEGSTDFTSWQEEVEVVIPASGQVQATIPIVPGAPPRFYRARAIGGTPPTGEPAQLGLALLSPTQLQLNVIGTSGSTYAIESTADHKQWTQVTNVTIPAGKTNVLVTLPVAPDSSLVVFRASTTGTTPPPPAGKQPTLALTLSGTDARLTLTGGDPRRTYGFQSASADWASWTSTTLTVVTDADGNGSTTVPIATGQTALFLRALAQ